MSKDHAAFDTRSKDGYYTHRTAGYLALYPVLREAARRCGYALAIHGSVQADLDLLATPWTDEATDEAALVQAVVEASGGTYLGKPGRKPRGRVAHTIHLGRAGYIDLSVVGEREAGVLGGDDEPEG